MGLSPSDSLLTDIGLLLEMCHDIRRMMMFPFFFYSPVSSRFDVDAENKTLRMRIQNAHQSNTLWAF